MFSSHRSLGWTLLMGLSIVACGPLASAQDDQPDDDGAPQPQQFIWGEETFDQWVFGNMGGAGTNRTRLESMLALQIEDVERACSLTPAQKKKLQLAGRGDLKRFYESVEEKRKKFLLVRNDQNKMGEIFQEIQPLQLAMNSGLFGEGSLYYKSIRSTVDATQAEKYEAAQQERRAFRYLAKIEQAVSQIDASIGFRVEQRRRFVTLLIEETPTPKKFGQYDYYLVLLNASRLPEAKLKPIFDEPQWRVMNRHFSQAKGMEPFLRQQGFVPADIPAKPTATLIEINAKKTK